jgi:hypothetical protein
VIHKILEKLLKINFNKTNFEKINSYKRRRYQYILIFLYFKLLNIGGNIFKIIYILFKYFLST